MIDIKHLTKTFEDGVTVLNDISEHIYPGEKVVILGPSGSGKSTFLRCLNLMEMPTSGTITFQGSEVTDPKVNIDKIRQGMGMVFLVLAILWMVLLIFKKVFYKDPAKQEKKEEAPAPAAPAAPAASVAPAAPAADDGALVAAITAAVAAYIDSDPALSSQFAGGFRVVSFKKKNGKTSWNH